MAILLLPIILLNFLGGIVAGIWLIVAGQWALVVGAFISIIVSYWILSLLLAPTLLIAAPLAWAAKRGHSVLIVILGALVNLWTNALMLLYGVGSFLFVFSHYEDGMRLPYLLLAYAVATGPWLYMAQGESRSGDSGSGTTLPAFGLCLGSLAMMIVAVVYSGSTSALWVACGIPLAIAWLLQMFIIISMAGTKAFAED